MLSAGRPVLGSVIATRLRHVSAAHVCTGRVSRTDGAAPRRKRGRLAGGGRRRGADGGEREGGDGGGAADEQRAAAGGVEGRAVGHGLCSVSGRFTLCVRVDGGVT